MWRVIWFKNPWKTNFCSISNRSLTGLNSKPTEEKNSQLLVLQPMNRISAIEGEKAKKQTGTPFALNFPLGLRKCVCCSQATRLASLLAAFFPNPMQEVCLWKDILVGKEVTPRHRIAWRLTRKWVSCLSSRQLWAKPFQSTSSVSTFSFFF